MERKGATRRSKFSQKRAKKRKSEKKRSHGFASIIIPTVNQTDMVKDCILAVRAKTQHIPYEIIVVDDGSAKEAQDYLADLAKQYDFKLILKDENEGFGKTCNRGVKEARGDCIVFLNNDVIVQAGWLLALLKVVEKDESVGIVGAKLLYPDETIQHAGIFFSLQTGFDHRFRFYNKGYFQVLQQVEVIGVTFALALVTRKVIQEVGMFDETLYISLEDVDFCLRAKKAGFNIVYCPTCVAVHLEGKTRGRNIFDKDPYWLKKEIETIKAFYTKWTTTDTSDIEGLEHLKEYWQNFRKPVETFFEKNGIEGCKKKEK